MRLDDLKKPWIEELSAVRKGPQLDELKSRMARARRDVLMRDVWTIFPMVALAGIVLFNWWAQDTTSWQSRIAAVSFVVSAAIVVYVLLKARRANLNDNSTVRARLEREIEWMRKQTTLLLNVGYWFLLPIFLVMVISSILLQHGRTGSYQPRAVLWALYAAYAVIALLAIWLCRREANRRFIPLLSRMKELRRDLVG